MNWYSVVFVMYLVYSKAKLLCEQGTKALWKSLNKPLFKKEKK